MFDGRDRDIEIEMEEENSMPAEEQQYYNRQLISPEIVEIGDESKSIISSRDESNADVFVAVGKNDLNVVKWALDHVVSPGVRVFLVHVFPPITYIPTIVGRLSRSQFSKEMEQFYVNEESNRRKNLLQKYIRLCNDTKVAVDTMLLESNATAKAILDLIPVVNITNLIMGTKRPPSSRRLRKGLGKGEFVRKNAPDFCEVTIVYNGQKVMDGQQQEVTEHVPSVLPSTSKRSEIAPQSERNFFDCICFSAKFN